MPITRYFGMAPEGTYNEAWGTPSLIYLDIAEANITGDQNPESVPTMTYPGPTRAVLGDYSLAGNLNTVADTDLFGHLLKAAHGQVSTEQEVGWSSYQHIFHSMTPRAGVSTLPSYKIALGEDTFHERRLTGSYVPSLELNYNLGESLAVVANVICADEVSAAYSSPAVADHPADSDYIFHMNRLRGFVGESSQSEFGASGEANALEALSLTLNTNPTDDWRKSGSRRLHKFFVQEQEITGSLTLSFENLTELYRYFEGGETPTATTPAASRVSYFPLIFACDLGILVDDDPGGSELYFRVVHYMPKCYYTSYGKPQSRRDRSTIDIAFKALIPSTAPDLDAVTYDTGASKVAFVPDTEFTDSTETNRENAALFTVLHNAVTSYA